MSAFQAMLANHPDPFGLLCSIMLLSMIGLALVSFPFVALGAWYFDPENVRRRARKQRRNKYRNREYYRPL